MKAVIVITGTKEEARAYESCRHGGRRHYPRNINGLAGIRAEEIVLYGTWWRNEIFSHPWQILQPGLAAMTEVPNWLNSIEDIIIECSL